MTWRIELTGETRKQLKKIGHAEAKRIRDYLRQRVEPLDDPRQIGKPPKGQFADLWRYRVGDHRVICKLHDEILMVLVIRIGHRRKVYR